MVDTYINFTLTVLYASFLKWQGHQGIFSLVKDTLWGNCKFLLGYKGHKGNNQRHVGNHLHCLREVSGLKVHRLQCNCSELIIHLIWAKLSDLVVILWERKIEAWCFWVFPCLIDRIFNNGRTKYRNTITQNKQSTWCHQRQQYSKEGWYKFITNTNLTDDVLVFFDMYAMRQIAATVPTLQLHIVYWTPYSPNSPDFITITLAITEVCILGDIAFTCLP